MSAVKNKAKMKMPRRYISGTVGRGAGHIVFCILGTTKNALILTDAQYRSLLIFYFFFVSKATEYPSLSLYFFCETFFEYCWRLILLLSAFFSAGNQRRMWKSTLAKQTRMKRRTPGLTGLVVAWKQQGKKKKRPIESFGQNEEILFGLCASLSGSMVMCFC